MQYNIWIIDPENDSINIIKPDVEGIDAVSDAVAVLNCENNTTTYDYALVGGEYEQLLIAKSAKIRKAKEQREKRTRDIKAEAQALIADKPYLEIGEDVYISEYTGKPYTVYSLNNKHLDDGIYNIDEEFLVDTVQEYINSLQATTKI